MRGVHSAVDEIRRNVFTEVARLAYEGGDLKPGGHDPLQDRSRARWPITATTCFWSGPLSRSGSGWPWA